MAEPMLTKIYDAICYCNGLSIPSNGRNISQDPMVRYSVSSLGQAEISVFFFFNSLWPSDAI